MYAWLVWGMALDVFNARGMEQDAWDCYDERWCMFFETLQLEE